MRIYIDGACFPNPGNGSWAFVVLNENEEIVFKKNSVELNTTNNRMECKAIIEAMKWVVDSNLEHIDITIYSDSQLIVNTYNTWMHKWSERGWKKKKSGVKNLDLVKELYSLKQMTSVELVWVKGHSGILGNEIADYLCSKSFNKNRIPKPVEFRPRTFLRKKNDI